MIRIDVEEYCQSCLDFSPDIVKPIRDINDNTLTDTVIRCEHRKRCSGIARYLSQKLKEESEVAVG